MSSPQTITISLGAPQAAAPAPAPAATSTEKTLQAAYYIMMIAALMLLVAGVAPLVIYSSATNFSDPNAAHIDAAIAGFALLIAMAMVLAFIITLSEHNAVHKDKYKCNPNEVDLRTEKINMAIAGIVTIGVGAILIVVSLVDMYYRQGADVADNQNRIENYGTAALVLASTAFVSAIGAAGAVVYVKQANS